MVVDWDRRPQMDLRAPMNQKRCLVVCHAGQDHVLGTRKARSLFRSGKQDETGTLYHTNRVPADALLPSLQCAQESNGFL